ncbi:DUF1360 domain-containing protein [Sutcliffiella deserti]|uniref:DUF1360 domain-containing protein n=1 Tax=Sutcliffiella deserti TaxID=2875501 RepID=UPI001CBEEF2A|nr:DUF1360 domain-containing protein [Sutcliffiella deserti]
MVKILFHSYHEEWKGVFIFEHWYWFILLGLASFRLTRLIVSDKITYFLRRPFVEEVEEVDENGEMESYLIIKGKGIRAWIGELISCHWCTGVWVTTGLFFLYKFYPFLGESVLVIFAAAGVAGIVESFVNRSNM